MKHSQYLRCALTQLCRSAREPVPNRFLSRCSSTGRSPSLPIPPPAPTSQHNDLPSFLAYATRTSLSPSSTTYIGTHYEYTVLQALRSYAVDLSRIGGRADSGIDLVGTWSLPAHPHPLRVIVQCKALRNKLGPNIIRELEGTFAGAPVGWRGDGILGVLVSPREATKGVRDALAKSRSPLMWILADAADGAVRQILWNGRASEVGLQDLEVRVKHRLGTNPVKKEMALAWDGIELKSLGNHASGDDP
ncbi:hypothetical protein LOZ66_006013 [Ophidiomyces ophidiicola]|nr:hypothetical protein LOZ66_006013 [Ophidiomyces ophidiicola]